MSRITESELPAAITHAISLCEQLIELYDPLPADRCGIIVSTAREVAAGLQAAEMTVVAARGIRAEDRAEIEQLKAERDDARRRLDILLTSLADLAAGQLSPDGEPLRRLSLVPGGA